MKHALSWFFLALTLTPLSALACDWPGNGAPDDRRAVVLDLCNRANWVRGQNGTSRLILDGRLIDVAQGHAQDMAFRNYFSHVSPEGWDPGRRLRAIGMPFGTEAENLGWGNSALGVFDMWMGSGEHRNNILTRNHHRVGVGVWDHRWVMVLTD